MEETQGKTELRFLTEAEVIGELERAGEYDRYRNMGTKAKKFFMDFCTGRSMKALTYDKIFKRIFNHEKYPKRLEEFLSELLGFPVTVIQVLPVESERIVESGSVLIMDLIVRAGDGSLINVEMQKCPYKFAGERDSCYLSDLVIRQYNDIKQRARDRNEIFHYRDMKPVYSIIIVENSYGDMLRYENSWEHVGKMQFEDGLQMNFLENIRYIRLDNFRKIVQNVSTKKEEWMYLLSADTPERVLTAATFSGEMFEIVSDIAVFVRNIGEVVDMFSDVLQMLDRNTEKLMYDEMMEDLRKAKEETEKERKRADKAEETARKKEAVYKLLLKGCAEQEIMEQEGVTAEYIQKLKEE